MKNQNGGAAAFRLAIRLRRAPGPGNDIRPRLTGHHGCPDKENQNADDRGGPAIHSLGPISTYRDLAMRPDPLSFRQPASEFLQRHRFKHVQTIFAGVETRNIGELLAARPHEGFLQADRDFLQGFHAVGNKSR